MLKEILVHNDRYDMLQLRERKRIVKGGLPHIQLESRLYSQFQYQRLCEYIL